jgi:outer membrane protein, heavy metal efflux system
MRQFRNSSGTSERVRRSVLGVALVGCACAIAAHAAESSSGTVLDLHEAAALAIRQQPLLTSLDAQARAAREASVSSAQLPDPRLVGGIRDLPIDTHDAYSISNDSDTQLVLGVSQEFPRAAKRKLRAEQRVLEADRLAVERRLAELSIRRDASFAWLDRWRAESARHIAAQMLDAAQLQADAAAIDVRSGAATQSDYVSALLNVERSRDVVAQKEQASDEARFRLERWIGVAAQRPVPLEPPQFGPAPAAAALMERLPAHPELAVLEQRIDESHAGVELAEAGRLPDWRVEFGYGYRRDYSDMVMLQVGMDLPVFRGNRQNRDIASALATGEAAAAQWEDGKRQLESRAMEAGHDLERINERVAAYDRTIEPQSNVGIEAATAAWRSGRGTLGQVVEARRVRLDVLLARLDLQYDALKRRVELDYLMGGE